MDKLNAISIFCKVIETQSFTLAAKQQNISVAMASKLVSQLEEQLKTRLLQRTTRKIMPTEAGMMYYQRCQGILLDLDEADSSITHLTSSLQGNLLISVPRDFGLLFIVPNLPLFIAKHPNLHVEIEFNDKKMTLWQKAMILHYVSAIWRTVLLYHAKSAPLHSILLPRKAILRRMASHKHLMI